jgi:ornithine cyclodeaminase
MLYLNEELLQAAGRDWNALINTIKEAVFILDAEDYAQPIKPYLKYGDPKNRIIAMPAFAGGHISLSGIKWIASFPGNLKANLPRAHSVTILNEASTGVPVCIINTTLISEIRTAAVTAAILEQYIRSRSKTDYHIAIFGFGPIGKMHLEMVTNIVAEKVGKVSLFDPRGIREDDLTNYDETVVVANSWNEIYDTADIVITCTNSSVPFIDRKPKPGSVQLNVSLRDYFP